MFLAHFSGWQYSELMEMKASDLSYWYHESVKLHNKLNSTE